MGHITLPRGGQLSLILFCCRKLAAMKVSNKYICRRTVVHRYLDLTRTQRTAYHSATLSSAAQEYSTLASEAQECATSPRSVIYHYVEPLTVHHRHVKPESV